MTEKFLEDSKTYVVFHHNTKQIEKKQHAFWLGRKLNDNNSICYDDESLWIHKKRWKGQGVDIKHDYTILIVPQWLQKLSSGGYG